MGNITSIKENGIVIESYTYDNLNQLKTVTNGTDTWEYTYDNGGNILSVKKNGVVEKSYTYGDTEWKDLLTNYNGTNITYDAIGNPLSYRDGMSFTWADGRKLTAITKGTDNISYTYDANGLRNSKTVNGTATQYYWLNGILQGQKTGSEYIIFLHDENGTAYGFMLKNGTTREYYYYIFNAQGDVIGILDSHGTQVVKYTYNVWGELLSTTGTKAETIGAKNPIRYRGYYYDSETGFYYLQSRYYDPITQRFVNADGAISGVGGSIQGYNMFAYCFNDPVNMQDETGNWPSWNDIKTGFKKAVDWTKKNIVEPAKETISKTWKNGKKIYSLAWNSLELKLCSGFGIGAEATVDGIGVSLGVKAKFPEATIASKSDVDTVLEFEAIVDFVVFEMGYRLIDYGDESKMDIDEFVFGIKEDFTILECEVFALYGLGFSVDFKLKEFVENLVVFYE